MWGDKVFERDLIPLRDSPPADLGLLRQMLRKGLQSPVTSSAGRLFDAVAALIGLRQCVHFEGQAAMELEFAIESGIEASYNFRLGTGEPTIIDWEPLIEGILKDLTEGQGTGLMAAKFHNTLAEIIVAVAEQVGEEKVILSGGCFQNRYLIERSVQRLLDAGFRPYWHQRVPTNDGGIALGQVMAASHALARAGVPEEAEAVA
jgi:hydrogenase maturation protein HypF